MSSVRKILHLDMDAFYASIEQRDNPQYRGKPLVVGGSPHQRGAVAAASYEARKYGIHSAMPSRTALQRYRDLIFVKPRFEVYRAVSHQIREVFSRYTDLVEPLALDEAYLDVTDNKKHMPSATEIATEIKEAIWQETGLNVSAGVSINKFLAKMASGLNKPNGLVVILPKDAALFVESLPIEKFHGIGKVTAAKMHQLGIRVGADLKRRSEADLLKQFGKPGRFYYSIARAQDERAVTPNRPRKSIGAETTFAEDLDTLDEMNRQLEQIAQTLKQRLDTHRVYGHTLTLKLKYEDYQQLTRSNTLGDLIQEQEMILSLAKGLLAGVAVNHKKVRLLGLSLTNLATEEATTFGRQLSLTL